MPLVAALLLGLPVACGAPAPPGHGSAATVARDEETHRLRGRVVRVEPAFDGANAAARARGVTVADASGVVVTAEVEGPVAGADALSVGHLEEHRTSGRPVLLVYRNRGIGFAVVALDD